MYILSSAQPRLPWALRRCRQTQEAQVSVSLALDEVYLFPYYLLALRYRCTKRERRLGLGHCSRVYSELTVRW